jgi:plastocyanin
MFQRSRWPAVVGAGAITTGMLVASAFAYTEKKVEKGATLKGVVRFTGDLARANQKDTAAKDTEACGTERVKPDIIVDPATKALQDVVVYIKKIDEGKAWTDAQKHVVLDQKKCVFERHVTLVAAGGEVVIKNSDSVLHNVNTASVQNGSFNEGVGPNSETKKTFAAPEFMKISCSVHPWMNAAIVVMANPYYSVTDEKGEYSLPDIPAGKYSFMVQHTELGKFDKKGTEIELKEGETKTQDFELK